MSIAKGTIISITISSTNMGTKMSTVTDKAMGMDTNTATEVDMGADTRAKLFVTTDV
jgi:hypothetical protein